MYHLSNGKIGSRELLSIVIFMIALRASDTTPDLLFDKGLTAAWMIPIFSFGVLLGPYLVLLRIIKKHNHIGLIELIDKLSGRPGRIVLGLILFTMMFISVTLNSRGNADIIKIMYYQLTPLPIIYILLMAAVLYISSRGFETIGRLVWFVFPFLQLSGILLIALVWTKTDWARLFPLLGTGIGNIAVDSVTHSSIFGEMILLTAVVPFVKEFKNFKLTSLVGFAFGCFNIILYTVLYIAVFDVHTAQELMFPFHHLTRMASFGFFATNLESGYLALWVISIVAHFSVVLYLTVLLFAQTLRLSEVKPLILPFTGLIIMLGMLPENVHTAVQVRERLIQFSSVFLILLPFFLWGLDWWKGRSRNEES